MKERIPGWFIAVCVLVCVPALFLPFLPDMEAVKEKLGMLMTFYPVYVICGALCAGMCYVQRRAVAWILIGLVVLSHLALFLLSEEMSHYGC